MLVKDYWKIDPVLETTTGEYQSKISGTTAALIIGDRALEQRKISPYIFDLGFEWKKFTGLPFVFAAWVSNKRLDTGFIDSFNAANNLGLNKIKTIVDENPFSKFNLNEYYTKFISFQFNDAKQQSMKLFLEKMSLHSLLVG